MTDSCHKWVFKWVRHDRLLSKISFVQVSPGGPSASDRVSEPWDGKMGICLPLHSGAEACWLQELAQQGVVEQGHIQTWYISVWVKLRCYNKDPKNKGWNKVESSLSNSEWSMGSQGSRAGRWPFSRMPSVDLGTWVPSLLLLRHSTGAFSSAWSEQTHQYLNCSSPRVRGKRGEQAAFFTDAPNCREA